MQRALKNTPLLRLHTPQLDNLAYTFGSTNGRKSFTRVVAFFVQRPALYECSETSSEQEVPNEIDNIPAAD